MGEDELSVAVFLAFDVDLDLVARFEFAVIAQFGCADDAVGFESDVYDCFAVVDRDDGAFDNLSFADAFEGVVVCFFQIFVDLLFFLVDSTPVKIRIRLYVFVVHKMCFLFVPPIRRVRLK